MQELKLVRRKIYGGWQRILHWGIAGAIILLAMTGVAQMLMQPDPAKLLLIKFHIVVGYLLSMLTGLRIILGIFGRIYARFSFLMRRALHNGISKDGLWGQHRLASGMYILLYAMLLVSISSGIVWLGAKHNQGPFASQLFDEILWLAPAKNIHLLASAIILIFIVLHLIGMLLHEIKTGIPTIQSMFSGYQYCKTNLKKEVLDEKISE